VAETADEREEVVRGKFSVFSFKFSDCTMELTAEQRWDEDKRRAMRLAFGIIWAGFLWRTNRGWGLNALLFVGWGRLGWYL
jgi:hypothetical protein